MSFGANQYKKTSITTASREQVLIMLYEAAVKHTKKAISALEEKNLNEKGIAIGKVHDIIVELHTSLNFEAGGKVAADLEQLYNFIVRHLIDANIQNSDKKLKEVQKILENLLEGWRGAVEKIGQERKK